MGNPIKYSIINLDDISTPGVIQRTQAKKKFIWINKLKCLFLLANSDINGKIFTYENLLDSLETK